MRSHSRIVDQVEQVEADLAAIDDEVRAGDLDEATADALRKTYRSELNSLRVELETNDTDDSAGPSRRRIVAGVGIVVAGLAAVTVLLMSVVADRAPGDLATGGISADVASGAVELADVTNEEMEAVVAENPTVVGMRAALARRYFEERQFPEAVGHYLIVLEQDPSNAEALANVGWMSFLSNEPDLAESYVLRALDAAPGYADALWYLGNIRLYGLDDPAGAIAPLQQLLDEEELPAEVRTEVERLLAEAGES